jgi:hypothetical protein
MRGCVADFLDSLLNTFGNCATRAFDFGGCLGVAGSEIDGGDEVARDRVHLVLLTGGSVHAPNAVALISCDAAKQSFRRRDALPRPKLRNAEKTTVVNLSLFRFGHTRRNKPVRAKPGASPGSTA